MGFGQMLKRAAGVATGISPTRALLRGAKRGGPMGALRASVNPKAMMGMDPGAARRAQVATGPYGGSVATQGEGGFKTMDAPAVAPGPPPPGPVEGMGMAAPAESMKAAWQAEMSPYGPSKIRPENAPNRMLARRTAGMQMF